MSRLVTLYEEGAITEKRRIISSIFPEKLVFDGSTYRTKRLNEAVRLICLLDDRFRQIPNRKSVADERLSGLVALPRLRIIFITN